MIEIPPRFSTSVPEPGDEGKTPQWFKAVKRVQKTNAVRFPRRDVYANKRR